MTDRDERLDQLRIAREDPPPRRSRRGVWIAVAVAVLLLATAAFWLMRPRGVVVSTAPVREARGTTAPAAGAVLNASGYVTARLQATVSSKVTGKVTEILVEEGMAVERGQVLARLDDAAASRQLHLAEAQLDAAHRGLAETEAELAEARRTLGRTRELVAGDIATAAQLDADRTAVEVLEARLERQRGDVVVAERQRAVRRQELDDTVIRAPFAGIAVSKDAQPGEMISPVSAGGGFTRTGICTLVDMGSLEIEVDVNESYIGRVRPRQRVEATLDAYPDWRIPAHVITLIPTADRQKATVKVRIGFEGLDERILPDMGVKVAFLEPRGTAENGAPAAESDAAEPTALLVPLQAVRETSDDGTRGVVFVPRGESVERRAVRLGAASGNEIQVLAGLAAGERVVVEGPADLAAGDRIHIEEAP
jgi:RND family efflux transporter MFP subunit